MSEHPISNLMSETMSKIKEMVDVNTIIGTPITTADGTTVIPVSKVTFGFRLGRQRFYAQARRGGTVSAGIWRRRRRGRHGIAGLLSDHFTATAARASWASTRRLRPRSTAWSR